MISGPEARRVKAQLLIWWVCWASNLLMLGAVYFLCGRTTPLPTPSSAELLTNLVGFVPLFLSVVIRWLMLPRYTSPGRGLVIFILGMSLAEACGWLGIFLGGPYRDALFVLGVLGIIQYAPFYAKRLFVPKSTGFIPNN